MPKINASSAHLCSATRRIHKLQTPGSEHAGPGELELPTSGVVNAKWRAGTITCVLINPSQGACNENCVAYTYMGR